MPPPPPSALPGSMSSAPTAPPWPLEKLEAAVSNLGDEERSKVPAIVLYRGVLGITTYHELALIGQARLRLEDAGYAVLAGWLSPCHDEEVEEVARQSRRPVLGSRFRVRVAELAVQDDDFLSVSSWEALQPKAVRCETVLDSLQESVTEAGFTDRLDVDRIRVFAICQCDDVHHLANIDVHRQQGQVVVPRDSLDILMEEPSRQHWVSEAIPEELGIFSVEAVLDAIRSGDHGFVARGMAQQAMDFCTSPSADERLEFSADFNELCPLSPSDGPWDCGRFAGHLSKALAKYTAAEEDGACEGNLAVLVSCRYLGPALRRDTEMLANARDRLTYAGFDVIGSWLCPASQPAASDVDLSLEFRLNCIEMAALEDEYLAKAHWHVTPAGSEEPATLTEELQLALSRRFEWSLEGRSVRVFYVCLDSDRNTAALLNGLKASMGQGVVVVPSDENALIMEKPHLLVYVADGLSEEAAATTPATVRDFVAAGDGNGALRVASKAVARFLCSPTELEISRYQSDFRALGVEAASNSGTTAQYSRLTTAFQTFVGPTGLLRVDELQLVLSKLDPSWTAKDMDNLLAHTKFGSNGIMKVDDFLALLYNAA